MTYEPQQLRPHSLPLSQCQLEWRKKREPYECDLPVRRFAFGASSDPTIYHKFTSINSSPNPPNMASQSVVSRIAPKRTGFSSARNSYKIHKVRRGECATNTHYGYLDPRCSIEEQPFSKPSPLECLIRSCNKLSQQLHPLSFDLNGAGAPVNDSDQTEAHFQPLLEKFSQDRNTLDMIITNFTKPYQQKTCSIIGCNRPAEGFDPNISSQEFGSSLQHLNPNFISSTGSVGFSTQPTNEVCYCRNSAGNVITKPVIPETLHFSQNGNRKNSLRLLDMQTNQISTPTFHSPFEPIAENCSCDICIQLRVLLSTLNFWQIALSISAPDISLVTASTPLYSPLCRLRTKTTINSVSDPENLTTRIPIRENTQTTLAGIANSQGESNRGIWSEKFEPSVSEVQNKSVHLNNLIILTSLIEQCRQMNTTNLVGTSNRDESNNLIKEQKTTDAAVCKTVNVPPITQNTDSASPTSNDQPPIEWSTLIRLLTAPSLSFP